MKLAPYSKTVQPKLSNPQPEVPSGNAQVNGFTRNTLLYFSYFVYKSIIEEFFRRTIKVPVNSGTIYRAMTAGHNLFAGMGALISSNVSPVPFLTGVENQEYNTKVTIDALCSGVLSSLVPLMLPAGPSGIAAYLVIYAAGRTISKVAMSSRYDHTKTLMENIKQVKEHRHLPVYYALDFMTILAFPMVASPFLSTSTSLSNIVLFQSAVKAVYYSAADKFFETPFSKLITEGISAGYKSLAKV